AYEYGQAGNLTAAWYYINQAFTLPTAPRFPEWLETRAEIEQKIQETKSRSTIIVPDNYERRSLGTDNKPGEKYQDADVSTRAGVLRFPPRAKPALQLCISYKGSINIIWTFKLTPDFDLLFIILEILENISPFSNDNTGDTKLLIQLMMGDRLLLLYE